MTSNGSKKFHGFNLQVSQPIYDVSVRAYHMSKIGELTVVAMKEVY